MGSKVNSIGVSRELAGFQSWEPPKVGMRGKGKELGEEKGLQFFRTSAIIEI
jgi:hypothetical protein